MIKVNVLSDSVGNYRSIELKGHAGYDDYGKDIICASVSSLTLNMANSIEQFTHDRFDASVEEATGYFKFSFKGNISPESKLLIDSLILGIKSIQESYGEKYIKIRFEEV